MTYYSAQEMKNVLQEYPQYREKLYCRGFLLINKLLNMDDYPFYGNWNTQEIAKMGGKTLYIYSHRQCNVYTYSFDEKVIFLIGHAYNPFSMQYREEDILHSLALAWGKGKRIFWELESELTGVFFLGVIENSNIIFSTDCTGMQMAYYGSDNDYFYITSHSKLVADIFGYTQDDYIKRLVNSKFYHYWGTFLPGDLSAFKELRRVQPNFEINFCIKERRFALKRYFPTRQINEVDDVHYDAKISEIAQLLMNSMKLISLKWPNKEAAISVTGGRDSTMTLSSANKIYDQFGYFSYISSEAERVDAEAAEQICNTLRLKHTTYVIPDEAELYKDIDIVKKILECNAGCIGHNNLNDVKKRIYLDGVDDFEVEIKSWVDELARGEAQNKYNTKRFPRKPTVGYYRCMWKVIVNPRLIRESNKIFKEYLNKYYTRDVFEKVPWTDLFYWEFSWGAGEGMFLTSEHRYSYDITIPYNNRKLLSLMFEIPKDKRIAHKIPIDVIRRNDKRIEDSKVFVKNTAHTNLWSFIIRMYVRIFSKF